MFPSRVGTGLYDPAILFSGKPSGARDTGRFLEDVESKTIGLGFIISMVRPVAIERLSLRDKAYWVNGDADGNN